jgi:hypothetical protein
MNNLTRLKANEKEEQIDIEILHVPMFNIPHDHEQKLIFLS